MHQPLRTSAATVPLTLADVRAAAARIAGQVVRTPTLYSKTLSAISGADIWLKFENLSSPPPTRNAARSTRCSCSTRSGATGG